MFLNWVEAQLWGKKAWITCELGFVWPYTVPSLLLCPISTLVLLTPDIVLPPNWIFHCPMWLPLVCLPVGDCGHALCPTVLLNAQEFAALLTLFYQTSGFIFGLTALCPVTWLTESLEGHWKIDESRHEGSMTQKGVYAERPEVAFPACHWEFGLKKCWKGIIDPMREALDYQAWKWKNFLPILPSTSWHRFLGHSLLLCGVVWW